MEDGGKEDGGKEDGGNKSLMQIYGEYLSG
jgi:hypothetical protein